MTTSSIIDMPLERLNTKCLIMISKFARALYQIDGTVLKLQDRGILTHIVKHARLNDDHQLQAIYMQLKNELKTLSDNSNENYSSMKFPVPRSRMPKEQLTQ